MPACIAWIAIRVCQWSVVPMVTKSMSLRLQNLSVVLVTFGFALGKRLVDAIDPLRVQVAYGDQIRQPAGVVGDSGPPSANAYGCEAKAPLASFAAFAR